MPARAVLCFWLLLLLLAVACTHAAVHTEKKPAPPPFSSSATSSWIQAEQGTGQQNYFRTTGLLNPEDGPVTKAIWRVSGIGAFKAYLNVQGSSKVWESENVLEPGTTDFNRLSLYAEYDVTEVLAAGFTDVNYCLGIKLGNGWYGMPQAYHDTPKLRAELEITQAGSINPVIIGTDSSWQMAYGGIRYNNIYNGERYDENFEPKRWNTYAYVPEKDADWIPAIVNTSFSTKGGGPQLLKREFPPIQVNQTLAVQTSWEEEGYTVVDFGREFSGVCEITVVGTSGSVAMHHGEVLNYNGSIPGGNPRLVYFANLRSAQALDNFTAKPSTTNVTRTWKPDFTYHGFRFVQLNFTGDLKLVDIKAKVFYSAVQPVSRFTSNNAILNTLHQHILWGQTSNLMSYPSDCDQRDERLGWMADGWLSADEAVANYNMSSFYYSWVRSMIVDQVKGGVGDVTPFVRFGSRPADPSWGLALPWIVRVLLSEYGDVDAVQEFYPGVKAWTEMLLEKVNSSGIAHMYAYYGDWVPPPPAPKVNNSFVSAVSLLKAIQITSELAYALGATQDFEYFESMFTKYSADFNKAFYNATSATYTEIGVNSQSTIAIPMSVDGLTNPEATVRLLDAVEIAQYHLNTGIIGLKFLFDGLTTIGEAATAHTIVTQRTYPGYAYEWLSGRETPATTLWEIWNAPDMGPGMNSRNHIMDGSVDTWMWAHVGGIQRYSLGADWQRKKGAPELSPKNRKPFVFKSEVSTHFTETTFASAEKRMNHIGQVSFSWKRHGGRIAQRFISQQSEPVVLDCQERGGAIEAIEKVLRGPEASRSLLEAAFSFTASGEQHSAIGQHCVGKSKCVLHPDEFLDALNLQRSSDMEGLIVARCSRPTSYDVNVTLPANVPSLIHLPRWRIGSPRLSQLVGAGSISTAEVFRDTRFITHRVEARKEHQDRKLRFVIEEEEGAVAAAVSATGSTSLACRDASHLILSVEQVHAKISLKDLHELQRRCEGQNSCEAPASTTAICGKM